MFFAELQADLANRRDEQPFACATAKSWRVRRCPSAVARRASGCSLRMQLRIIFEDFFRGLPIALLLQRIKRIGCTLRGGMHQAFGRKQDFVAVLLRHFLPELLGKNLSVRLEPLTPTRMSLSSCCVRIFAESVDFTAHAVEHLAHGIDLGVSALVTFHREPDGDVLGEAQKSGLIRTVRRSLRRDSGERLRQRETRASRKTGETRLKGSRAVSSHRYRPSVQFA